MTCGGLAISLLIMALAVGAPAFATVVRGVPTNAVGMAVAPRAFNRATCNGTSVLASIPFCAPGVPCRRGASSLVLLATVIGLSVMLGAVAVAMLVLGTLAATQSTRCLLAVHRTGSADGGSDVQAVRAPTPDSS